MRWNKRAREKNNKCHQSENVLTETDHRSRAKICEKCTRLQITFNRYFIPMEHIDMFDSMKGKKEQVSKQVKMLRYSTQNDLFLYGLNHTFYTGRFMSTE